VGKRVLHYCTVGYKWVTMMNDVKFEFNAIISLGPKSDSERRQAISIYDITKYIWWYYCEYNNLFTNLHGTFF